MALRNLISLVALLNTLVYSYVEYNVPVFGYLGYPLNYSFEKHLISNLLLFILTPFMPSNFFGCSKFVFSIVISTCIVPILALFSCVDFPIKYLILIILQFLIIRFFALNVKVKLPERRVPSGFSALSLCYVFCALTVVFLLLSGGAGNINFDIFTFYDTREVAMERFFVGPMAYIINWVSKGFAVYVFAVAIFRKSITLAILSGGLLIFMTLSLGQKTPIFMVFFVAITFLIFKYKPTIWVFNLGLIGVIISTHYIFNAFDLIVPYSVLVKRIFFAPAYAMVNYFDYFSINPHTFLSDSILRYFIDYPYKYSVQDLIALEMTGDTLLHPNVGVLGTGYQHAGVVGILLFGLASGLIFSLIESLSRGIPDAVVTAVAGPYLYILLTSSDFFRSLLTHGGLVVIALLFFSSGASFRKLRRPSIWNSIYFRQGF
ncbi:hypothetical protein N9V36_00650 [Luminiphilus sp.]|nr:hypothetical protein [Luminiphilus sp.]